MLVPTAVDSFVCPAFFVQTSTDQQEVNAAHQMLYAIVKASTDPMGKSAKDLKNVYEADDIRIGIPCLVNTLDLDAGEELVMFKAVEEKKQHRNALWCSARSSAKKAMRR